MQKDPQKKSVVLLNVKQDYKTCFMMIMEALSLAGEKIIPASSNCLESPR